MNHSEIESISYHINIKITKNENKDYVGQRETNLVTALVLLRAKHTIS
jgi:hypothetical protein